MPNIFTRNLLLPVFVDEDEKQPSNKIKQYGTKFGNFLCRRVWLGFAKTVVLDVSDTM